jgi:hypothetical protein
MKNLAHEWVKGRGLTVEQARSEWDGVCVEFAGELADAHGGRLAYFDDPPKIWKWKYHAAAEINGMIHDLWRDGPAIPLGQYEDEMGCDAEYPAEEKEEFTIDS